MNSYKFIALKYLNHVLSFSWAVATFRVYDRLVLKAKWKRVDIKVARYTKWWRLSSFFQQYMDTYFHITISYGSLSNENEKISKRIIIDTEHFVYSCRVLVENRTENAPNDVGAVLLASAKEIHLTSYITHS